MENQAYRKDSSRVWGGLLLLGIGATLFLQKLGVPMPFWLFRWPMILILIGTFLGLRQGFRNPVWLILILIGSIFLIDIIQPEYSIKRFTAPIIFIVIGLGLIFRRNALRMTGSIRWSNKFYTNPQQTSETTPTPNYGEWNDKEDYIDSVAFFGNIRKVILSKDFKGGDMFAVFGGSELDFSQADINQAVVLDVTQIFGGTKLLVPATWEIRSEMVAFFGGIEDKRIATPATTSPQKTLVLKGTTIFGGIQIRSY